MPIEEALALHRRRLAELRPQLAALPLLDRPGVTLEIGCGHGHFLAAYAARRNDEFCLAIDLIRERLDRAARKTARAGLRNVAWIHAEAHDLLEVWPPGAVITRNVFILFPDPWPKRRHWKNRLIQPEFLSLLASRCAPGARLCFRTDHAPYFAAAAAEVAGHLEWEMRPIAEWPFEEPTVFQRRAPTFESLVARRRAPA